MKKNSYYLLIPILTMLFCTGSYNPKYNIKDIKNDLNIEEIKNEREKENLDIQNNNEQLQMEIPDKSGPVTKLPWENDVNFIKAKKEIGANVLMAAYCTVLKDPLPGEEFNVHLGASSIAGIVIQPNDIFSQNKSIGPYTEARGYQKGPSYSGSNLMTTIGGGVCKISSTLYNVSILSNLQIIERYNHAMPVPYVPYGQDATVAYGAKDFKFKNNTEFPILIWAEGIDNRLYVGFYGKEKPPEIEWNHKVLNKVEAPKHYRSNPDLKEGEEKVIVEGMDGATVESWITIKNEDGTIKTKKLGISHYIPMPYIIEVNK